MRLSAKKGARSLPKPPSPTGNPGNPDFLPRSAGENRVCAFPQRKVHEVCQSHQVPQEIRGTRISCHAALERTVYAPFRKERCTKCAKATKSHRKSGEPGFPATQRWREPRMRLSAKKGARSLPKPPSPTGNPGNPGFPATQRWREPRMRLSAKKGA